MLRNYIRIAFRNLSRNKVFSFINISGLAVGLATCLLIMLFISSELGYDSQFADAGRIYRVVSAAQAGADIGGKSPAAGPKEKAWASASAPVAAALKAELPEVEETARLLKIPSLERMLLTWNQGKISRQFYETNGYYVDSSFFRIFNYPTVYGNLGTAFNEPNSLLISETIARKMFGGEDPVGRSVTVSLPFGSSRYTIKAVFRDQGLKSHIPAHFFLSMRNADVGNWVDNQSNWATNNIFHTYVKIKQSADPKAFGKKLNAFLNQRAGNDLKALGVARQFSLQPLKDIYLHSDLDGEIAPTGNIVYLYILGCIAAFVLLIACINFMNLSTARSGKRAKEVGVRKVLGAEKAALVGQFLGESLLMSGLSLLLALCLAWILLPLFNDLTQKNLKPFDEPWIAVWLTVLTLVTGLLAGLYPAFYLSAFRPASVLKGRLMNNFSAATIRKALVVFQFTISIILICSALVIVRQLRFLNNRPLGFNKERQIVLPLQSGDAMKNYASLKNELLKNPQIKSVTSGSTYPGIENIEDLLYYAEGKSVRDVVDIRLGAVGDDYFSTLGFTMLEGRSFSRAFTGDSNKIVLNEAAIAALGYDRKHAVGKKIYFDFQGTHGMLEIIGVVRNFNFESLYNSIKPFGFTSTGNKYAFLIARFNTEDYAKLLTDVEASWKKINAGLPFVYSFMDQDFQRNYEKDQRASVIVRYFTVVTILIACLGLFGLSAFAAEQRVKELGIRKVLGASAAQIAALLSRDFIGLVCLGILIASPLAWYGMSQWLQGFAYRIQLSGWLFLSAGLAAILIALITVSFQAVRAAITNPVISLRTE